jgi:hypothetical protein
LGRHIIFSRLSKIDTRESDVVAPMFGASSLSSLCLWSASNHMMVAEKG